MFSEPVVGERFFGREEVLDLLNKRVGALKEGYRQNIALTGQSLAGKSSIILHFLNTIKDEGFTPIYVEVVNEPFRSFSNKFIATMLYNALKGLGEHVGTDMGALLERSQDLLPKTYLAIKGVNSYIERGEFDEAYSGLLGLTSILKEETGFPCIVILDEFDNLERLGVKNPFLSFGKVIMVQKDTMYIVSSSRNSAIKKIISEKLSLLFGNFEVIKVSNFDIETSNRFIDTKLAGFEVDDDMKKLLIDLTDGNPFYLGSIMVSAKRIAIEHMSSYIDDAVIGSSILELIYNANGVIHQYLLNFILDLLDTKYKDSYTAILVAIANGRNKQSEIARAVKTKQGEISKSLGRLSELGLISKNGVFYRIDDTMLVFWLKYVYERRRSLLVDGIFDKTELFREDVRSYIANFVRETGCHHLARLTELFNLFSNELIEIESKHIRLPHFTKVEAKVFQESRSFIACSCRGNLWIVQPYEYKVGENDIINYIRDVKALGHKISNKVIIPFRDMDENAKLLAKELKISIWDLSTVNAILNFYGKRRIIRL